MQIVIPHAERNNDLLLRNIPFITKNIENSLIYILTKNDNIPKLSCLSGPSVKILDEESIFPGLSYAAVDGLIKGSSIPGRRSGWYFQQFLKMSWAATAQCEDWYVVWDSDTFPLRKIRFFDETGKPLFSSKGEYNPAYFETMKILLSLERRVSYSFIAENMIFKKSIMLELLRAMEKSKSVEGTLFFEKIVHAAQRTSNPSRAFSEFETYGNYVESFYPGLYMPAARKSCRKGARQFGLRPSKQDLARLSVNYDIVSFERWDRIFAPVVCANKALSMLIYPILKMAQR